MTDRRAATRLTSVVLACAVLATACTSGAVAHQTPSSAPSSPPAPVPHRLVWSDEFAGTAVDAAKWNVLNNSTYGDGNQELACLNASNVRVAGGDLIVTAQRTPHPVRCRADDDRFPSGRSYTSGMLTTMGKAAWSHGLIEMRARLPLAPGTSQGLWPAFWMRPVSGSAQLGEMDILEGIGTGPTGNRKAGLHSACHANETDPATQVSGTAALSGAEASAGFHVYSALWTSASVQFAVDGIPTLTCSNSTAPWFGTAITGAFYLRLNLAVGGSFPGTPDATTALPASLVVDWVRVYQ